MRYSLLAMALSLSCLHGLVAAGQEILLPKRGLCAHRGAMNVCPENTLAAFREAGRLGAHMIELDVCLTKDGELVVIHDGTVDRTTDGTGKVSDLTLAEIKALDAGSWKDAQFAGERIPTFLEALRVMPLNCWLNVHLKGGAELGGRAAKVIESEGRLHQAFLACKRDAMEAGKEAVPEIKICNMDRQDSTESYVNLTIELGTEFIQISGALTEQFPEHTRRLHEKGIRVNYFGTDSPEVLRKAFAEGADFPLVNEVEKHMGLAAELGMAPVEPVWPESAAVTAAVKPASGTR